MSIFERHRTSAFYSTFYWVGIAMTLACLAFIFAGNTDLLWRFEHSGFPLSWVFGAIAIVSFLAAESCPLSADLPDEWGDSLEEELSPSTGWESADF
jgi:hypothetical protein